jgi:hypothetical protein
VIWVGLAKRASPTFNREEVSWMTGRRAVIGLSLLSALVFCAFAAPNAMALKAQQRSHA